MKTDYFTKTVLTLIVVLLAIIAGERWTTSANVVHAAPTRTWEYKTAIIDYLYKQGALYGYACSDDEAKTLPCDSLLDKLGAQGWELVCVHPDATMSGFNYAGMTTSITYTFKR